MRLRVRVFAAGIVVSVERPIIRIGVRCSQALAAQQMKHGTHLAIGVMVLIVLAAQAIAAPTRAGTKKPPPKPAATKPAILSSGTTFVFYDVGTLRMTGKSLGDTAYTIGPLRLTGRAQASTVYRVGTLKLTGAAAQPVTYDVGTLSMTGKLEP